MCISFDFATFAEACLVIEVALWLVFFGAMHKLSKTGGLLLLGFTVVYAIAVATFVLPQVTGNLSMMVFGIPITFITVIFGGALFFSGVALKESR